MSYFPGAFLSFSSLVAFSASGSIISLPSSFITWGGFPLVSLHSALSLTYSFQFFVISVSSYNIFPSLSLKQLLPFCLHPCPVISFIVLCISLVLCCDWSVSTSSHFVYHHSSLALLQSISIFFMGLSYLA